MTAPRSPLKARPLRNPGQSLDEEIQRVIDDRATSPFIAIAGLWVVAGVEWLGAWRDLPRQPWWFTIAALAGTCWLAWRVNRVRAHVQRLRQGRDGERAVGQFLEGLREAGARIFHDVPGDGFNLDHVVISRHGIYVIETKTITKPGPDARVHFDGEQVTVAGHRPDRDPVRQASSEASWLSGLLEQSTGRKFPVRGVVAYPGWWVERTNREQPSQVLVLEPKALPAFIEAAPIAISPEDVAMAAYHLSRYVRGENRS
jgi:Nuclease-related domain